MNSIWKELVLKSVFLRKQALWIPAQDYYPVYNQSGQQIEETPAVRLPRRINSGQREWNNEVYRAIQELPSGKYNFTTTQHQPHLSDAWNMLETLCNTFIQNGSSNYSSGFSFPEYGFIYIGILSQWCSALGARPHGTPFPIEFIRMHGVRQWIDA